MSNLLPEEECIFKIFWENLSYTINYYLPFSLDIYNIDRWGTHIFLENEGIIIFFTANIFITLNHRLFHGLVILVIRKRKLQQSAIFRGTIQNISNNILHYNFSCGDLF